MSTGQLDMFGAPAEPPDAHPAKWSTEILAVIAPILRDWRLPVHDPFAGTGERLGNLCDQLGLTFTGTDIEPEFARDARVHGGDSTEPDTYPTGEFCVVTSPAYPNGMTDHFKAGDNSRRHTYRQALATILGYDGPLHDNNMGRYGIRYGQKALARHYVIADACIPHWPQRVVVNVSDFYMAGEVHEVVAPWRRLLERHGYDVDEPIPVKTPRQRNAANADLRVDHEAVLVARRMLEQAS
jgi:hypothetical protein